MALAAGAGSIGGGDVELAAGEAADGMQGGAVKMAGGSGSGGVVMTGGAAKSDLTAGGAVSIQGGAPGAGATRSRIGYFRIWWGRGHQQRCRQLGVRVREGCGRGKLKCRRWRCVGYCRHWRSCNR